MACRLAGAGERQHPEMQRPYQRDGCLVIPACQLSHACQEKVPRPIVRYRFLVVSGYKAERHAKVLCYLVRRGHESPPPGGPWGSEIV